MLDYFSEWDIAIDLKVVSFNPYRPKSVWGFKCDSPVYCTSSVLTFIIKFEKTNDIGIVKFI